jgi:Fe-S cluster assembly iron-binding protein IscA
VTRRGAAIEAEEAAMLQLTPKATSHLVRKRRQRGLDDQSGARFVSKGSSVGLTFVAAPEPGDRVIEQKDIAVYVAPEVAAAYDGALIDTRLEQGKSVLVLRRQPGAGTPGSASG